jgi:Spy/CpxP family protein refolding chaperone
MKTIILAAAVMALTIASAQAQDAGGMGGMGGGGGGMGGGGGRHHGQQQKDAKTAPAKPKVDEKAYNSALKGIPDKPYDAWHGVR